MRVFCGAAEDWGKWFRVFGFGLRFLHDDHAELFAEREGRKLRHRCWHVPLIPWRVGYLTPRH